MATKNESVSSCDKEGIEEKNNIDEVGKMNEETQSDNKTIENETPKKGPKFVVAKEDPTKDSLINSISLFVDENKQFIQNGLYIIAFFGVIKIGR